MVRNLAAISAVALFALVAGPAMAQAQGRPGQDSREVVVNPDGYPEGVAFRKAKVGFRYVDASGKTLYALNSFEARSRGGFGRPFCIGPCEQVWAPLTAPADAKPVGRWKVMPGAKGPQWAYGNNLVFTYIAEQPGETRGDGIEDIWSVAEYVPPVPQIAGPAGVKPVYVEGGYRLANGAGHALYSTKSRKAAGTPYLAGAASLGVGDWTVASNGNHMQWQYHGKPVFISQEEKPTDVPAGAIALVP